MIGFQAIGELTEALRTDIAASLTSANDMDLAVGPAAISLDPPGGDRPEGTVAHLYLYHFEVDPHLRNGGSIAAHPSDPELLSRAPLPLHLRYLFVPIAEDAGTNHAILGRVLQHLRDVSRLRPAPGSTLATVSGHPGAYRIRLDQAGWSEQSHLWSALDTPYRLSAQLLLESAPVESGRAPARVPRADDVLTALQHRTREGTS